MFLKPHVLLGRGHASRELQAGEPELRILRWMFYRRQIPKTPARLRPDLYLCSQPMLQEQGGSGVRPSGWTVAPLSLIICSFNQLNDICVIPPKNPFSGTLNIHCQKIKENKAQSNMFLLKKIYFCTSSHKVVKSTAGWPFSIETYSTERFRVHSRREIWWVFILKTLLMTWARLTICLDQ